MLLFTPACIWAVPALLLYIMYYLVFVIHIYLAFVNNIGGYSPYLETQLRFPIPALEGNAIAFPETGFTARPIKTINDFII